MENLAAQLEAETIDGLPDSRNLRVFLDIWDMDLGENMVLRMGEALARSRFIAPVLTPEFLKAQFANFEWTHVVAEDPINRMKRLLPILLRDVSLNSRERITLPPPFRSLLYTDFRQKNSFNREFLRLLTKIRGQRPTRRRNRPIGMVGTGPPAPEVNANAEVPDRTTEVLVSNLLPLLEYPKTIFSCPVSARKYTDFYDALNFSDTVLLKSGRCYSFANLRAQAKTLTAKIGPDPNIESESPIDWFVSESRRRDFIQLCNRCLNSHLHRFRIKKDSKGRYFFLLNSDGSDRTISIDRDPARTVAAIKKSSDGLSQFFVHHAARIKFCFIGRRLFLEIDPCYLFTEDGNQAIKGVAQGKLAFQWGGRQGNAEILRNTIFWVRVLAYGKPTIEIPTGSSPLLVSGLPGTSRINVGISDDTLSVGSLMRQVERNLTEIADDVEVIIDDEDQNDEE